MDAISAILAKTRTNPAVTIRKPHINPAVPPSVKAELNSVNMTSHVEISVQPNPRIEMKRKFLWRFVRESPDSATAPAHPQNLHSS
jgi:hypothetical protein